MPNGDSRIHRSWSCQLYSPSLREGLIVNVDGFEVALCTNMYKIADHPFFILFIPKQL